MLRGLCLILCLGLTTPALGQELKPDVIRRETPYRPRHLLPIFATLAALGLVTVLAWRVRKAKAEALERL